MIAELLAAWLGVEFAYAAAQRAYVSRPASRPSRFGRLADLLFEPLRDEAIATADVPFRARDVRHAETGSVYRAGATLEIELSAPSGVAGPLRISPVVRRVGFDPVSRRPQLTPVIAWDRIELGADGARASGPLPRTPGMYVVEFANPTRARVGLAAFVTAESLDAPVVILPTFTMWGYHRTSGFYPGHARPTADRRLGQIGRLGLAGRVAALAGRIGAKRLFGVHVTQPTWPVNRRVRLDAYFETNHRWTKQVWDPEIASIEGLWNDDIDITIPFFALADAHGCAFRLATDLDLHRQDDALLEANRWIFVGQESLSANGWRHLERFVDTGGGVTLWCPQGFGYRQVEYDDATRTLSYVCSRGRRGFWNEPLEDQDPPWDEGAIFGFRFPSPDSSDATNPHRVQYGALTVGATRNSTIAQAVPAGTTVRYPLWANGAWRPGLNWMGGEPFRRVRPDAVVHVHMSEDADVIGYGTFGNTAVVSPTFLGALWAYGGDQTLVDALFRDAVASAAVTPRSRVAAAR